MATATKKTELVEIKPVDIRRVKVRIVGDSPLITHKWSEKAKKEIRDKELGLLPKGKARPIRKPIEEAVDSLYWVKAYPSNQEIEDKGREYLKTCHIEGTNVSSLFHDGYVLGFPAVALKLAALAAAYRKGWIENMISVKGEFRIEGCDDDPEIEEQLLDMRFVRVKSIGDITPVFREDNVRVGMGSADLRYRAQVNKWYADIIVAYDANGRFTLNHILNFLNAGGFACGIGEWRTEKDGDWGSFHVEEIPMN